MQSDLIELGLSNSDAKIYLALLKEGGTSVGLIIKKTGFYREVVYGGLKRLEKQGLVQSKQKKKVRFYQANDPAILARKIQEKADLAKNLLPDLQTLFKQPRVSVQIFEGPEGYEEIQKDIWISLKNNEDYYVIGGAGDAWYAVTKNFYQKYHQRLLKRNTQMKTVTFSNEAKGIAKYENPAFNPIRIIPEKFSTPSSTMIYADKIIIHVFGEAPLAIMIQSQAISQAYKKYFFTLWVIGKPFKY